MKNILFVYSSLKEKDSATNRILEDLEQHFRKFQHDEIRVVYVDLGKVYQEDPYDIEDRVVKAFKALDKKRLSAAEIYQEKLLVLARYTKRLTRDLLRVNAMLAREQNTVKIFSRNLRQNPVVPYNEQIHDMIGYSNPKNLLDKYKQSLTGYGMNDGEGGIDDIYYPDIPSSSVYQFYTDLMAEKLNEFKDFLNLYIANRYINEYLSADELVVAAPIYNHNIPTRLQNYLNYFVRSGITFTNNYQAPLSVQRRFHKHPFYNKKWHVVVTCAEAGDLYNKFVSYFFEKFTQFIGVERRNLRIEVLGNRVETNSRADQESKALIAKLAEELTTSILASKESTYNVAKLKQLPDYGDYPRLHDFYIAYKEVQESEGETISDDLIGVPFRLDNYSEFNVPYSDREQFGQEFGKRSLTTVSFTNFIFVTK